MKTLSFLLVARENLKNVILIIFHAKFSRNYLILPLVALLVLTGLGELMSLISEIETLGDLQSYFFFNQKHHIKIPLGKPRPLLGMVERHICRGQWWRWCCKRWWRYWGVYIGRQRYHPWHDGIGGGQGQLVLVGHPSKVKTGRGKLVTRVGNRSQPIVDTFITFLNTQKFI